MVRARLAGRTPGLLARSAQLRVHLEPDDSFPVHDRLLVGSLLEARPVAGGEGPDIGRRPAVVLEPQRLAISLASRSVLDCRRDSVAGRCRAELARRLSMAGGLTAECLSATATGTLAPS